MSQRSGKGIIHQYTYLRSHYPSRIRRHYEDSHRNRSLASTSCVESHPRTINRMPDLGERISDHQNCEPGVSVRIEDNNAGDEQEQPPEETAE